MRVIVHEFLSFCLFNAVFLYTRTWVRALSVCPIHHASMRVCILVSMPERLMSRDCRSWVCLFRCSQKHIHSRAASVRLYECMKEVFFGLLIFFFFFQLTLLAAGRHGVLTKFCLLTLEWRSQGLAGLGSWPWELGKSQQHQLRTMNNEALQFEDIQMCGNTVHIHYVLTNPSQLLLLAIKPYSCHSLPHTYFSPHPCWGPAGLLFYSPPHPPLLLLSEHFSPPPPQLPHCPFFMDSCCAVKLSRLCICGTKLCYNRLRLPS